MAPDSPEADTSHDVGCSSGHGKGAGAEGPKLEQTEMRNKKLRRDASLRRERTRFLSTLERQTMPIVQRLMTMFRGNRAGTVGVRHCHQCLQAPDILDLVIWSNHNFFFFIPQYIYSLLGHSS